MTDIKIKIGRKNLAEKAALLASPRNPIVQKAAERLSVGAEAANTLTRRNEAIKEAYKDLSYETLRKWLRREVETVDESSVQRIIDGAKRAGFALCVEHFLPSTSKYDLGEELGLDFRAVQRIVDKEIFGNRGHARGFYLNRDSAKELAKRFEGLYHLYHYAPPVDDSSGPRILKSALRVRYALPFSKSIAVVRCKLHVPLSNELDAFASYDGVLTERGNHLYWYFEEVSQTSLVGKDMVSIIGQSRLMHRPKTLSGVYMSLTGAQQIYCSSIQIVRTSFSERDSRPVAKKLMREDLRVYGERDFESIPEAILNGLSKPYTPLPPLR